MPAAFTLIRGIARLTFPLRCWPPCCFLIVLVIASSHVEVGRVAARRRSLVTLLNGIDTEAIRSSPMTPAPASGTMLKDGYLHTIGLPVLACRNASFFLQPDATQTLCSFTS